MMNKLISIIIPTYNRAHLIGETLNSLIQQSYINWECIIVDDGSTDITEEVVSIYCNKDPRIFMFKRPETLTKGPNSCRNFGFLKSKGKFVKWLDSDDLLLPDALNKQIEKIKNNTDVVVSKLLKINLVTNKKLGESNIISEDIIGSYLTGNVAFYVSGPLWRKKFLLENNLFFDPLISNLDDWDFNLRALYNLPVISFTKKPLIIYRMHESSLSSEIKKLKKDEVFSEIYAREKHLKLLKDKNHYDILNRFLNKRLKFFLRNALEQKNNLSNELFLITLKKLSQSQEFSKIIFICIGFCSFKIFGRGYKILK